MSRCIRYGHRQVVESSWLVAHNHWVNFGSHVSLFTLEQLCHYYSAAHHINTYVMWSWVISPFNDLCCFDLSHYLTTTVHSTVVHGLPEQSLAFSLTVTVTGNWKCHQWDAEPASNSQQCTVHSATVVKRLTTNCGVVIVERSDWAFNEAVGSLQRVTAIRARVIVTKYVTNCSKEVARANPTRLAQLLNAEMFAILWWSWGKLHGFLQCQCALIAASWELLDFLDWCDHVANLFLLWHLQLHITVVLLILFIW